MRTLEREVKTTELEGNYEILKNNFLKIGTGVLWGKAFSTREKRKSLTKYDKYNKTMLSRIYEIIYLKLVDKIGDNINKFTFVIRYTLEYESSGKIISIKNLNVAIYQKIGCLSTNKYLIKTEMEDIFIELFYSKNDARTFKILKDIKKIEEEFKDKNVKVIFHDWDTLEGRKEGDSYKIRLTPTIQIDEIQLIDPSENQIRNAIMELLNSNIEVTDEKFE